MELLNSSFFIGPASLILILLSFSSFWNRHQSGLGSGSVKLVAPLVPPKEGANILSSALPPPKAPADFIVGVKRKATK